VKFVADNKAKEGKVVIFSAPSGAGKTTIVQHLLKVFPDLEFSISACSREIRRGETYGVDYYYLTVDEFKEKITNNEFAEWEEVYKDNFYGTLKSEIERIWRNEKHIIFDMDVIGGLNLKKQFGDKALAVFVMPPSLEHLENRLKMRETETPESIARRMGKAELELKSAGKFDKIIHNDDLEKALEEAENIVGAFLKL
jgi:guanylate kinase